MPSLAFRPAGPVSRRVDVPRPRSFQEAEAAFLAGRPEFEKTRALDLLRDREFSRLDEQGQVYLDYAGSGLYADTQVRRHSELLLGHVLGNPHSTNPASAVSTRLVERCRRRVLDYFRASEDEYYVVFTANASQALKLVGESYPFEPGGRFLLTFDNHNLVNGIREFARVRGARTLYVPVLAPDLRADEAVLDRFLDGAASGHHNLFAYPAQSNVSGVRHPLGWMPRAHARGWDVLLDAAALVPSSRLDLSRVRPDFVALFFYKMFGFPTGVGALIARREALDTLRRPWFAGGTIDVASVQADRFVRAPGARAFEDGTVDFANLPAVEGGLDLIESVGIETIHERIRLLAGWLIEEMSSFGHPNGRPLVRLYGPAGAEGRGGTIAFNRRSLTMAEAHRQAPVKLSRRSPLANVARCARGARRHGRWADRCQPAARKFKIDHDL